MFQFYLYVSGIVLVVQCVNIPVQISSIAAITRHIKDELPIAVNLYRVYYISDDVDGFMVMVSGHRIEISSGNKVLYRNIFNNLYNNLRVISIQIVHTRYSQYYLIVLKP